MDTDKMALYCQVGLLAVPLTVAVILASPFILLGWAICKARPQWVVWVESAHSPSWPPGAERERG